MDFKEQIPKSKDLYPYLEMVRVKSRKKAGDCYTSSLFAWFLFVFLGTALLLAGLFAGGQELPYAFIGAMFLIFGSILCIVYYRVNKRWWTRREEEIRIKFSIDENLRIIRSILEQSMQSHDNAE